MAYEAVTVILIDDQDKTTIDDILNPAIECGLVTGFNVIDTYPVDAEGNEVDVDDCNNTHD